MTWTIAEPESRELLAICLKKLKGLSKVRLIDAGFIWTEPHSKRIKVKEEVDDNNILPKASSSMLNYGLRRAAHHFGAPLP